MAERKTKAERKASAGQQTRAERRAAAGQQDADQQGKAERKAGAGQQTRAERKQARGGRRQRGRSAAAGQEDASPPQAEIESRLARIEEAVASQSERSEELLGKLDEVLHEARKSARHAKSAVAQADDQGD